MRNRVIAAIVVLLLAAVPSACTPASAGGVANLVAAVAGGSKGSGTEVGGDAPGRDEAGSGTGADDPQPDADGGAPPQSEPQRDDAQSPDVKAHLGFDPGGGWPDTVDEQYYYLLNIVQSDPVSRQEPTMPWVCYGLTHDVKCDYYQDNGGMLVMTPPNPANPVINGDIFDDLAMGLANGNDYWDLFADSDKPLDESLKPVFADILSAYDTPGMGSRKYVFDVPRRGITVGVMVKPQRSITFVSDGTLHPAEGE